VAVRGETGARVPYRPDRSSVMNTRTIAILALVIAVVLLIIFLV
jgi:hypothetical protein